MNVVRLVSGQVTLEYFLLFAALAIVTLIGLTNFDDRVKGSLGGWVNSAAANMAARGATDGGGGAPPVPPGPPDIPVPPIPEQP